jgi:hypothetical protein
MGWGSFTAVQLGLGHIFCSAVDWAMSYFLQCSRMGWAIFYLAMQQDELCHIFLKTAAGWAGAYI